MPNLQNQNPGTQNSRWWLDEGLNEASSRALRGQRLSNVASTIYRVQEPLRHAWMVAWRLYSNQPIMGLGPKAYKIRTAGRFNAQGLNLCKAAADAYTSLITKDEPRTFFDVTGGDRKLKKRAKQLQSFVDGLAYETGLKETKPLIVRDSAVFGCGVVKIFRSEDNGKPRIAIERRHPWWILVDEQEAAAGWDSLDNVYEIMWVDKRTLIAKYPDLASQIRLASSGPYAEAAGESLTDTNFLDFCVVVEGWHKPRIAGKDGSGDGRHTIIVGNVVLEDEPYYWDRFPFEYCYRDQPIQGVYSQGIPNELAPQQLEINRIMRTISQSQRLAVGHWFVEQNSDVDTNAINNVIASVIRYSGVKPEYIQYPPVTPDVYDYLKWTWMMGFESLGISQMASQSALPPGLKSEPAINAYEDVSNTRFKPAFGQYEHWNLRVTQQIIHLAREISEDDPSFEVSNSDTRSMMRTVRWADAGLAEDEFKLKLREINALGDSVPAKMQTVSDMTSAGLLDQDSAKRMLLEDGGLPDLTEYESLEASSYNFVEWCADSAIDEGIYKQPSVYVDSVPLSIARMQKFYIKATMDGVPDDRLRLLRQWMDEAAKLLPPPPPPGAPPPGGPPGQPMPKPGGPLAVASQMAPPPKPPMAA